MLRIVQHYNPGSVPKSWRTGNPFWEQQYTLVVDTPFDTFQDGMQAVNYLALMANLPPVEFVVGWSRVHPNDEFVRKIGLETAIRNMKPLKFTLVSAEATGGGITLQLSSQEGELGLLFRKGRRTQIVNNTLVRPEPMTIRS